MDSQETDCDTQTEIFDYLTRNFQQKRNNRMSGNNLTFKDFTIDYDKTRGGKVIY